MIESNQDIIGLSTFIITRLLSNDAITKDYSRSINPENISNDKGTLYTDDDHTAIHSVVIICQVMFN